MGNSFGVEQEKNNKKHKFGGYKNVSNPRPGYYKTPSEVYYRGEAMRGVSPSTFEKLGNSWARDHQHVYFKGEMVHGADQKTFKVINKLAKDKNGEWYRGKKVT